MVKRVGSSRRKTRKLYAVPKKMKGKLAVSGFVKKLEIGDNVVLKGQPSVIKGMYFRRFHGRMGRITGKQGTCYFVQIQDGGQEKQLLVSAVHLRKV
jgi:large subunit ribosomal protein L21e